MDPETKRQSKEWHTSASPCSKKARMSKSKIRSMLICFFDSQGIVRTEFVPQWRTVNQFYYREILERLRKRVVCMRPRLQTIGCSITTMALVTWRSLLSNFWLKRVFLWCHSPHTPMIWVRTIFLFFLLFPKLKLYLKGHHFWIVWNIEKAVTNQLKAIPVSDFQWCYEEWDCLQRCVASQGNYFEGDKLDL